MNDSFQLELAYDAPLTKVWYALTDLQSMKRWYFPQIKHFDLKVGSTFGFVDDGAIYKKEWTITRLEKNKILAYSWLYKGYPGCSEVTFELSEKDKMTSLRLTHTGISSFPDDPHFAYKRFEDGWKMILDQNLRHCLEDHKR